MKILMVSYPRAGSHFLSYSIMSTYSVEINKKHPGFIDFDGRIINIPTLGLIRNPLDSIASFISLQEKRFGIFSEYELEKKIMNEKESYFHSLDFIKRRVEFIVDHSGLKDIQKLTDIVGKQYNLEPSINKLDKEEFYKNIPDWQQDSSKNHPRYDYIRNVIEQDGLTEENNLYLDLFVETGKMRDVTDSKPIDWYNQK